MAIETTTPRATPTVTAIPPSTVSQGTAPAPQADLARPPAATTTADQLEPAGQERSPLRDRKPSRGVTGVTLPAPGMVARPDAAEPVVEIDRTPLSEILAKRAVAAVPVHLGSTEILCTYSVDPQNWDTRVLVWLPGAPEKAVSWLETELDKGVSFTLPDGGAVTIATQPDGSFLFARPERGESATVQPNAMLDALYQQSVQKTFGGIITYAVIRNADPRLPNDGIVLLRINDEGVYYYSYTTDDVLKRAPHYFVGINGVLYAMQSQAEELRFLSKTLDLDEPAARARPQRPERAFGR